MSFSSLYLCEVSTKIDHHSVLRPRDRPLSKQFKMVPNVNNSKMNPKDMSKTYSKLHFCSPQKAEKAYLLCLSGIPLSNSSLRICSKLTLQQFS